MKIDALHLMAFGPFTGHVLDFSRDGFGFHLVYGSNEAGKSSALRALRALLYGIDERSPDGFIHPYSRMRIGGTLRSADGEVLEIVRRKGRINTLRDADDREVVDESVLSGFLNNMGEDLFCTMFGIGYDDLVAGGREIVSGGGDLGQLVFSAGSGIVRLRGVRDALHAEAEGLYKPSGKNPRINEALSSLKETDRRLRDAMLPGNRWVRMDKELRDALSKRSTVESSLRQSETRRSHLVRVRDALPLIARRREVLDDLAARRNAALLPQDFSENRRSLVAELDTARRDARRAQAAIESIEKEMKGLSPSDAVIDNASLIESFHQQLGSQRKAAADRLNLETRRASLVSECRGILKNLLGNLSGDLSETRAEALLPKEVERLRLTKEQTAAIRRLSSEYGQIAARIENDRDALPGLEAEIERLSEKQCGLPEPVNPEALDSLQSVLDHAAECAPLEKQHAGRQRELDSRKKELENRLDRLGLSGKNAHDLDTLSIPSKEAIQAFEERLAETNAGVRELDREIKDNTERIRDAETRIQAREMTQSVCSEADLAAARSRRNEGWRLVRVQLDGAAADDDALSAYLSEAEGQASLADAFEQDLGKSDEVADRLRREADRVAEHARLHADREAARQRQAELDREYERALAERAALSDEWNRLWEPAGIRPETPREMERWVRDAEALKADLSAFARSLRDLDEIRRTAAACSNDLAKRMRALGKPADPEAESLGVLLARAKKIVDDEKALAGRHEKIGEELAARKKELAAARKRLEAGEAALEHWRTRWQAAVGPLGLSADALPAEADAVMEEIRSLFEKVRDAETFEKRIRGIDRDASDFAEGVARLADAAAPDLAGRPPDDVVLQLHARLTRSREAKSRYNALEKQLAAQKKQFEEARKTAADREARLARMCEEAGCTDYTLLPEAERQSEKRRELEAEKQRIEDRLLELSAGATVDEFVEAAGQVDPDGIEPEIGRCDEAIASLSGEKDRLAETIGSLRNELSGMDGGGEAAELAQKRQEILGRLDPDARRYARVRIATRILDRAIERFREKNQGPLLRRASDLFAEITCGSFRGVRAEFDGAGNPVIAGVRGNDGDLVYVPGMSDGTADQLYLALRMAGLEMTIEKSGPMPFVVDDILIKFDDQRAAAALKILANLSLGTQVIFFTHHSHLVDLAKEHIPRQTIFHHLS